MVRIGNFFFRYRNGLFIFLYACLFLPSPRIFSPAVLGSDYCIPAITTGILITVFGQLLRAATIGLAYIIRGGKNGQPHAEGLITDGMFRHCRNPLYLGNIFILLGLGILSNSVLFVMILIPVFVFIYQTMVMAEEEYLGRKFSEGYRSYCQSVNRWLPRIGNWREGFGNLSFNWRRWILTEYNTQIIWIGGIFLILMLKYPEITGYKEGLRNYLLLIGIPVLMAGYGLLRYLKKSGRMRE